MSKVDLFWFVMFVIYLANASIILIHFLKMKGIGYKIFGLFATVPFLVLMAKWFMSIYLFYMG